MSVRQAPPKLAGDRRLVGRVTEGEQCADSHRLGLQIRQRVELERHEHAVRAHPLGNAMTIVEGDERLRMLGAQPVEMSAVLPPQME